jgi:hypothetical protein
MRSAFFGVAIPFCLLAACQIQGNIGDGSDAADASNLDESSSTATSGAGGSGPTAGAGGTTVSATVTATSVASSAVSTVASSVASSSVAASSTASSTAAVTVASSSASGNAVDPEQLCVDTINAYRATLNLPPYKRWTENEACADMEAQTDMANMKPHSAFPSCGEWGQNECPNWGGPPEAMIKDCLAMMWAEGPGDFNQGHGHYINMTSTQFTYVSCGFTTKGPGNLWATQDFK